MKLFFVGLASLSALMGYMTAGSDTPVVAAIIPLIFGIITSALGILWMRGVGDPSAGTIILHAISRKTGKAPPEGDNEHPEERTHPPEQSNLRGEPNGPENSEDEGTPTLD